MRMLRGKKMRKYIFVTLLGMCAGASKEVEKFLTDVSAAEWRNTQILENYQGAAWKALLKYSDEISEEHLRAKIQKLAVTRKLQVDTHEELRERVPYALLKKALETESENHAKFLNWEMESILDDVGRAMKIAFNDKAQNAIGRLHEGHAGTSEPGTGDARSLELAAAAAQFEMLQEGERSLGETLTAVGIVKQKLLAHVKSMWIFIAAEQNFVDIKTDLEKPDDLRTEIDQNSIRYWADLADRCVGTKNGFVERIENAAMSEIGTRLKEARQELTKASDALRNERMCGNAEPFELSVVSNDKIPDLLTKAYCEK